jgi:flagellar protein FliS
MNPYFEQQILNAEPLELVRLVYKRAMASVREAREQLRAGRIAERSLAISNAYDALTELVSSLVAEPAPELASRLRDIYCYMQQRLIDANFEQADVPLAEVLGLLSTLAEAWDQIGSGAHSGDKRDEAQAGMWYAPSLSGEPEPIALNA